MPHSEITLLLKKKFPAPPITMLEKTTEISISNIVMGGRGEGV